MKKMLIFYVLYISWYTLSFYILFGLIHLLFFEGISYNAWKKHNIRKISNLMEFGKKKSIIKGFFLSGKDYIEEKDKSYFLSSIIASIIGGLIFVLTKNKLYFYFPIYALIIHIILYIIGKKIIGMFEKS